MVTFVQLEYIVAVDTHRNFAKASENCFVTQPTLSMGIKKLEDDLGVKIFDRSQTPVIPTEIGEKIIAASREILSKVGRLDDMVKTHLKDYSGQLHIGIITTLAPYLLPLFAGNLKKNFPNVELKVEELITEKIVEKLKNDQLDAGIFVTPYNDIDIAEEAVFYEKMLVYAQKGHPLLKKKQLKVSDINPEEIWMLNDGHCFRSQVINLCAIDPKRRNKLPYELEGGSLETLMRIINYEGGYTIIPELATLESLHLLNGTVAYFSDQSPLREVSVCYSRRVAKRRLIDLLINEIKTSVPPEMLQPERGEVVLWK